MIVGLGIDLVETERVERILARHGERFERRVFTGAELAECGRRADRIHSLAARFAAKEACLKALGTGWSQGLGFADVEVVCTSDGAPTLRLAGRAAERARELGVEVTHVSLTHQPRTAAAVVVLEG
jgi:holo-[acyl-carrier protein] synthase